MASDLRDLKPGGPDRVVIDNDGEAVSPRRAREEYGITPDVVFVRADGWALAAPKHLVGVAFKQWPDSWVSFCIRPSTELIPIEEWDGTIE